MLYDDMTATIAPPKNVIGDPTMRFRQGVIEQFNVNTAENIVNVGGAQLVNLPLMNSTESLLMAPGAVVGIISTMGQMFIVGRIVTPGSASSQSALNVLGAVTDVVSTVESITNSSYVDLATPGPEVTVNVPPSGRVLVMISCLMRTQTQSSFSVSNNACSMNWVMSGANTASTSFRNALTIGVGYDAGGGTTNFFSNIEFAGSRVRMLTGLTPGDTTFTAKYTSGSGSLSASFEGREITVLTL